MFRLQSRLAAVAATGAVLAAAAGCGGGSGGTDDSPKGQLVAGIDHLADSDVLTTTLRLDTTADQLRALAKDSGDDLSRDAAEAIAGARIVIETNGSGADKNFSLRGIEGDRSLLELRVVDKTLYLQADLDSIFAIAHSENILANLDAEAKNLPEFVQAFVNGKWVSLNTEALKAIAGSLGGTTTSASPAGADVLADLRDVLDRDVSVRAAGSDERGDHLVLTGNTKTLAKDLAQALETTVPGGKALGGKLSADDVPSRSVTLDAWLKDGSLAQLSLDLAQFADKGDVPAGTTLPITVTFAESGDDISAPGDVTPVDLTQLGSLIGALSGG